MKVTLIIAGLALTCGLASAQTQTQGQTQTQKQGSGVAPTTGQSNPTPAAPVAAPAAPPRGRDECASKKCTPEQTQAAIEQAKNDALRNLIDQKLLVQRAKDLDISVETGVIRELDQIRQEHNLETLEDLEKAIVATGDNYDDFKEGIRNHLLVNDVIEREVYSKVGSAVDHAQIQKYYDEHKSDYQSPELVYIREILVGTDGKTEADYPALEKKANDLRTRVLNGEDFGELAKHFSDGSTAKQGGELGKFERGMLNKSYEEQVFKLNRKEMTPVIHIANGFEIIQVEERYDAGIQPLEKVQNQIIGVIASKAAEPKLREYLATLRKDSFVEVHPGYVDTAAVSGESMTEVNTATIDPSTTKAANRPKRRKKFLIF
jgi:peptidyl-prolyl cis-trans isomerase SurA